MEKVCIERRANISIRNRYESTSQSSGKRGRNNKQTNDIDGDEAEVVYKDGSKNNNIRFGYP
jgi:hypothetical protein